MFSYFEENLIEKFSRESGFSNVGHVTFLRNENRYFSAVLKWYFFLFSFFFFFFFLLTYTYLRCIPV